MGDIFCHRKLFEDNILYETRLIYVVLDKNPASEGHLLVITKRHYTSLLDIPKNEYIELMEGIRKSVKILKSIYENLNYNIIYCEGDYAGQSIHHIHWHIITRSEDDNISIDLNETLSSLEYNKSLPKFKERLRKKDTY